MGGGGSFEPFLLSLAARSRPRICFLATATGDNPSAIVAFYERFGDLECVPTHLRLFGMPDEPARVVAEQDIVLVSGGNTANMLALWRLHGIDVALREAWERGAVLAGGSAGANCWFEASVTDSFGPQLAPLRDGLGLLAGSFCPHYDGEALRRPAYTRMVADAEVPAGIACDDGAAALYEGRELREVVATTDGASAYRVTAGMEERIEARRL